MKGWYEDYKDLRRDMIRQNLDEVHFYEEDRDIITSDNECSRCPHQVNCCGQCQGNYEELEKCDE